MRVVLDTNVFVSMALGGQVGIINDRGIPIITAREFVGQLKTRK